MSRYQGQSQSIARLLLGSYCVLVLATVASFGADTLTSAIAQKEIAKRSSTVREAQSLIVEAELLTKKGEHGEAAKLFRQAWGLLPNAPMTAGLRMKARDGFSKSATAQAEKLASAAQYAEARTLLQAILAEDFNPTYEDAKELLHKMDDPDRYEPALTPEHLAKVSDVATELRMAESHATLGDFDQATKHFQKVLRVDPYNSAARRGMERVDQRREEYADGARDHNRSKLLTAVDQEWEDKLPASDLTSLFSTAGAPVGIIGGAKINALTKLRSIVLPIVDFQNVSLQEAVEFLRIRSRDLDPAKKGVDFVLRVSPEVGAQPLNLNMFAVPMEEVLRYLTEMSGTVYRVEEFAVTISSRVEASTVLTTRSYRVPPDFLQNAPASAAPSTPANPFEPVAGAGAGLQIRRLSAREFLEQRGVPFPPGTAANYVPATNLLIVRNTEENLAMIDTLVEQAQSSAPKLVEVQVKMVQVNENRLKELGFDWLVGQANVPGTNRVFAGGGTAGNQAVGNLGPEVPFTQPGGIPVGSNPITAGLRSSGAILGTPSIDQLTGRISTPAINSRSPGTFAVAGVFTDPQFQGVLRTLSQSQGVDLLSAPSVLAKAGQRATIKVVREFIYPTEYDPPQIPQNINPPQLTTLVGGVATGNSTGGYSLPVTPSTPTAFEMRDVGITLEVEAVVGDNNRTIDLNLVPSSTEFEGFIDYGQDFTSYTVGQTFLLFPFTTFNSVVTYPVDNPILQPVFRSNKVTTSATIWDGQTLILGGVMYEKRQDIHDKVPLLGDIPVVGRSFQSTVTQIERKNVIFFVTARVMDPGGNPVNAVTPAQATVSR
ncbi:MAG: Amuc_1098 family type IV pilus outer membrane protein [Roseimicrobium sp.]